MTDTILVTGGAGFIGSAFVRHLINSSRFNVLNVDKLTYAGHLSTLEAVSENPRYQFEQVDIVDEREVMRLFQTYKPRAVVHLAAESHVDRSIEGPAAFIQTNIIGTYTLLEAAREYWQNLPTTDRERFRFLHISTDEVFGSLGETGLFSEETPYRPNSPYSASKASSDHLVRAWYHTYGLPTIITNCSNNYGPYQYPEKLIPLMILNALERKKLPVYGSGENVRDWLYVDDHVRALHMVMERGRIGETYNIGGHNEKKNIEVVRAICKLVDELAPDPSMPRHEELITFVTDRPGHDLRYAIDASKINRELGWTPTETFETGLRKTVEWYISNRHWCERVTRDRYQRERLGLLSEG